MKGFVKLDLNELSNVNGGTRRRTVQPLYGIFYPLYGVPISPLYGMGYPEETKDDDDNTEASE